MSFYGNSQFATNCYAVVKCINECSNILCAKIIFATVGVSIDDFFTRYAGLGYSLNAIYTVRHMLIITLIVS